MKYWTVMLLIMFLFTIGRTQEFDPGPILLSEVVTDSFDVHKEVYCENCPDGDAGMRDFHIYLDIPFDTFQSVPLRPVVLAVPPFRSTEDLCNEDSCSFSALMRDKFTSYGWITATLDYRKEIPGFLPTFICNSDPEGFLRGQLRGVQDIRRAVEFIRTHHEEYGIDSSRIFLYGIGNSASNILSAVHLEDRREFENYFFSSVEISQSEEGWDQSGGLEVSGLMLEQSYLLQPGIISQDQRIPAFLIHNACDVFSPIGVGNIFDCCQLPVVAGSQEIACRLMAEDIPYQLHVSTGEASGQIRDSLDVRARRWLKTIATGAGPASAFHEYQIGLCEAEFANPAMSSTCIPVYSNYCDLEDLIFKADLSEDWCNPLPYSDFDIPYDTVTNSQGLEEVLHLDFYKPRDLAPIEKRPLIIFLYQGGFILGSKEDMESFAAGLTVAGFVTAAIDYRLGWESAQIISPCQNDYVELKKAAYRAIQDTRSAINFFVDHAESFQVDTNHILLFGLDAGAVASLHGAFLYNGVFDPDISSELGPLPSLKTEVDGVISISGFSFGLEDYLSNTSIPLLMYHGSCDTLISYTFDRPFQCAPASGYEKVYGARCIADYGFENGFPFFLKTYVGEGHKVGALSSAVLGDLINTAVEFINFDVFCGLQRQEDRFAVVGPDCAYPDCDGVSATDESSLSSAVVAIFPNPFHEQITIGFADPELVIRWEIMNTNGLIVRSGEASRQSKVQINTARLLPGIYLLQITDSESGKRSFHRIVKVGME